MRESFFPAFLPSSPSSWGVSNRQPMGEDFSSIKTKYFEVVHTALTHSERDTAEIAHALLSAVRTEKDATGDGGEGEDAEGEGAYARDTKLALELALRAFLRTLAADCSSPRKPIAQDPRLPRLLDLVVWCATNQMVDTSAPFQLLEDMFDCQTIEHCRELFAWVEERADQLTAKELFGRKSHLALLRTLNELHRRLSKTKDVIFCGRIMMFLARVFPLMERSGVNVKSLFNLANTTEFEEVNGEEDDTPLMDADVSVREENEPPLDFRFYQTFWSLQRFFGNPTQLFSADNWASFGKGVHTVLDAFSAFADGSREAGQSRGLGDEDLYFAKFLTSSRLMCLQMRDATFRRHVLLQFLILFQHLLASTPKNPSHVLKEKQRASVVEWEAQALLLLEGTPPDGKVFRAAVEHILKQEKNWITWKKEVCPSFERSMPEGAPPFNKEPRRIKGAPLSGGLVERRRRMMGTAELERLWNISSNDDLCDPHRLQIPTVEEFLAPIVEEMDPEAGIEEEYKKTNDKLFTWKALRLMCKTRLPLFCMAEGRGLEAVVSSLENEKKGAEEKPEETESNPLERAQQEVEEDQSSDSEESDREEVEEGLVAEGEPTEAATLLVNGPGPSPMVEDEDSDVRHNRKRKVQDDEPEEGEDI